MAVAQLMDPKSPALFKGTAYVYSVIAQKDDVRVGINIQPAGNGIIVRFAAVGLAEGEKIGKIRVRAYQPFDVGDFPLPGAKLESYFLPVTSQQVAASEMRAILRQYEIYDSLASWLTLSMKDSGLVPVYSDLSAVLEDITTATFKSVDIIFKVPELLGKMKPMKAPPPTPGEPDNDTYH